MFLAGALASRGPAMQSVMLKAVGAGVCLGLY